MRRRCAFTLVELLVVVGIVAVLTALLLPVLVKARRSASTAACLSNLRQLGQAHQMYIADSRGYIVPIGYRDAAANTLDNWATIFVYLKYVQSPRMSSSTAPPTGYSMFRCPDGSAAKFFLSTDINLPSVPKSQLDGYGATPWRVQSAGLLSGGQQSVDTWYAINGTTFDPKDLGQPGRTDWNALPCHRIPKDGGNDTTLHKMSRVKKPAELVFLLDGIWTNIATISAARINARHGGGKLTNILCFDGHAETLVTATLPKSTGDFASVNSLSKYPYPKWRLDQ